MLAFGAIWRTKTWPYTCNDARTLASSSVAHDDLESSCTFEVIFRCEVQRAFFRANSDQKGVGHRGIAQELGVPAKETKSTSAAIGPPRLYISVDAPVRRPPVLQAIICPGVWLWVHHVRRSQAHTSKLEQRTHHLPLLTVAQLECRWYHTAHARDRLQLRYVKPLGPPLWPSPSNGVKDGQDASSFR